jgi:hypothetical protein
MAKIIFDIMSESKNREIPDCNVWQNSSETESEEMVIKVNNGEECISDVTEAKIIIEP